MIRFVIAVLALAALIAFFAALNEDPNEIARRRGVGAIQDEFRAFDEVNETQIRDEGKPVIDEARRQRKLPPISEIRNLVLPHPSGCSFISQDMMRPVFHNSQRTLAGGRFPKGQPGSAK